MRPFEVTRHVRAHLRERLDLTPAQVEKIDPIIEKLGADMWTIHREAAQRVARLMDNAHDQIAAQLTPDQRRKLDKLQEERQNRMGDRPFPFRPGGPPGPKGGHRPPPPGMEFPPPPHGDGPPHHERQPQGPPPGGV